MAGEDVKVGWVAVASPLLLAVPLVYATPFIPTQSTHGESDGGTEREKTSHHRTMVVNSPLTRPRNHLAHAMPPCSPCVYPPQYAHSRRTSCSPTRCPG